MKKALILSLLVIILGILMFFKENIDIKEDVYVVSQSESEKQDNIDESKTLEDKIQTKSSNKEVDKKQITIYISGEVLNPGIVTIEEEGRLYDAVKKLGGTTQEADLNRINLAIKLEDEKHYIIPKIGEVLAYEENNENQSSLSNSKSDTININNASIEELDTLPGVGEATANKIVKYREENSRFNSVEEIKSVNGIGDKKYEELKDLICVE